MRYLVMECRRGYAVVLDSEGRFLRVANMGYELGQSVNEVVIEQEPAKKSLHARAVRLLAAVACLCLILMGTGGLLLVPYGTVRMQINPDVLISVNRFQYVVKLEGMNGDGETLLLNYSFIGKSATTVLEELSDRSGQMGFLEEGGEITLTVKGPDNSWKKETEEMFVTGLQHHCSGRVHVRSSEEEREEEHHDTKHH